MIGLDLEDVAVDLVEPEEARQHSDVPLDRLPRGGWRLPLLRPCPRDGLQPLSELAL